MIEYPRKPSHEEVTAALWKHLQEQGFDARLQVRAELPSGKRCRLDMVIYNPLKIARVIIECKSWSRVYSQKRWYQLSKNTKQIKQYSQFHLPVLVCGRLESIPKVVSLVSAIISSPLP